MFQQIIKTLKFPLFFISLCLAPFLSAQANNKIVAIVNEQIITQNQLNQAMGILKQQSQAMGQPLTSTQLKKEALKQLVDSKLLLQIAEQNNISASDAEVKQYIKQITSANQVSLEQFKKLLRKDGSSFQAYSNFVKEQITLSKLRSQVLGPKVKVSEQDIDIELANAKKMNDQAPVNLLDVLVAPKSENEMSAAKTAAANIRKQLLKGKSLQDSIQAATNSTVQITPQELGWKTLKELPELFAQAAKNLPAGQISQPIEAPNGFHLLLMVDRKGGSISRQDAEKIAAHKKMQIELEKWLTQLKKQAYIEIK